MAHCLQECTFIHVDNVKEVRLGICYTCGFGQSNQEVSLISAKLTANHIKMHFQLMQSFAHSNPDDFMIYCDKTSHRTNWLQTPQCVYIICGRYTAPAV